MSFDDGRIFTDTPNPCASASSAQSVFYCLPPCLICVHPRLIFSKEYEKISTELERTLYELPAIRKAV